MSIILIIILNIYAIVRPYGRIKVIGLNFNMFFFFISPVPYKES
jgi:hypothetical protein